MQASERMASIQPYYFAKKLAEVRARIAQGKNIINLGIGSPDMATPTPVVTQLKNSVMADGAGHYQPYNGIVELRQAFSEWYQKTYDVSLNPATEILPLMGSKESVMHIHLAFCNPGDTVLVPNPGYPTYSASAKMLGLHISHYELKEENNWLPSLEELEAKVSAGCKVMWINYPHMPTGAKATKEDLEKLICFAKKHKLLLVNDNPYSLILNEEPLSIHNCDTVYPEVLELNSLSKSHNMAGWRVGMVSGSEENIQNILKVKSNFDSGMFKPIQQAAVEALSLGNEWLKALNEEYEERIQLVWEILDRLQCTYNKENKGMFVWAKVNEKYKNGSELSDHLLYEYDVFATPGSVFGSSGAQYIRFSLCATREDLKEALNRIKKIKVCELV